MSAEDVVYVVLGCWAPDPTEMLGSARSFDGAQEIAAEDFAKTDKREADLLNTMGPTYAGRRPPGERRIQWREDSATTMIGRPEPDWDGNVHDYYEIHRTEPRA